MLSIRKIIKVCKELNFKYLYTKSIVRTESNSQLNIDKNVKINNSRIDVVNGGKLTIGEGCIFRNVYMRIDGDVTIGCYNIFDSGSLPKLTISVSKGCFILGNYNRIKSRIMIRFGGLLRIGDRNNINDETEIRADENITIGDYNQISYQCVIWDTNTHNIYSDLKRRELTDKHYPVFGYEFEKPKTKPVTIGSDCWIGRRVSILKGVSLQNSSVVGYNVTLSNCEIKNGQVVVPKIENIVFEREKSNEFLKD